MYPLDLDRPDLLRPSIAVWQVGGSPQTPFTGLKSGGVFQRVLNCETAYDHDGMLADVLDAGRELQALCKSKGGELRAVLLECTNMCVASTANPSTFHHASKLITFPPLPLLFSLGRPPFSAAVARELNVAVYDILTLGKMVRSFSSLPFFLPLSPAPRIFPLPNPLTSPFLSLPQIYSAAVKEEYEFRLPSPPRGM